MLHCMYDTHIFMTLRQQRSVSTLAGRINRLIFKKVLNGRGTMWQKTYVATF